MPSKKQNDAAERAAEQAERDDPTSAAHAHAVRTEPQTLTQDPRPRTTPTADLYTRDPNAPLSLPARNLHPEAEAFLSELVAAALAAQEHAQGASETLYRVAHGEDAYPDNEQTAKAVIALAGQVNALSSVVLELARMVRHDDIFSKSKGLPH